MSRFFSGKYASLKAYVPGEQPQDRKYIKLNTNESPFPPSPIAQRMAREEAGSLELYSDPAQRALREAASQAYGLPAENIVFGNGSDEILSFAFAAFCDEELPAVFADITYGFYRVFAEANRVPWREIPLKEDFSLDAEDYVGAGGTVFIANPNAPTGIALPLSEIERIVAGNPGNVVVIDEAYIDFGGESAVGLIKKYDNLLVVQTFSKSRSLAGGRLGMGFAPKEIINDIDTLRFSANPYNVNRMTAAAGVGALADKDYLRFCTERIKATREKTAAAIAALGFELTSSSANFLFAEHKEIGGRELYLALKEKGILIRHFDAPRISERNRITVGSEEEMEAFVAAVAGILEEKRAKKTGEADR